MATKKKPKKNQTVTTIAVIIAIVLLIAAAFFDEGEDSPAGTMRDVAGALLTSEGQIDSSQILSRQPALTPQPTAPSTTATTVNVVPTIAATGGTTPADATANASASDLYQIYFTTPTCPAIEARTGGIDSIIADDMLRAQSEVDIAAFDLDSQPMVDALIALQARGVRVRVVTDTDNVELESIAQLRRNKITVVEDERSAFMHNKFVIIDDRYVWMGSMNFTTNDVYCNNNNIVRFDAPALAANYGVEMDEMYDEQRFGPQSPQNTPQEKLTLGGIAVENYFAPERELELINVIARTVVRANQEILFMAFSFTNEAIGEAMLGRADGGIPVRGIFEKTGAKGTGSYYPVMRGAGLANVEIQVDGNPRILHYKVIIVDRKTVIFGSFNFSANANRSNDENIIIVHDPIFASYFVQEFEARWAEAKPE